LVVKQMLIRILDSGFRVPIRSGIEDEVGSQGKNLKKGKLCFLDIVLLDNRKLGQSPFLFSSSLIFHNPPFCHP
jgi:hypothetical protein